MCSRRCLSRGSCLVPGPEAAYEDGGGDEHSGWSTIGRGGFILDNLLAAGKVKPMIVVVPNRSITLPGVPNPIGGGRPATPEGAERKHCAPRLRTSTNPPGSASSAWGCKRG